ncbi:hypothetical protein E3N88_26057 [Mikania micrantha]|uniref:Uncharacterized protein n=1 Tax=Mikania micrantha TaxID=192012 RepID=A0A5N6N9A5_9ASTR|nr:hypothetical protein E3N88_45229 [Mikania micrantha]KAD4385888.1 hypothetical protein E3N88_26057 [Mikania micrantha]
MSLWDESFFNDYVPDLNEQPLVEYSYGTIDLNAEPNADVGFDSQASYAQQNDYGFVHSDSKQSNPNETYEEKPADSNINWETKESGSCVTVVASRIASQSLDGQAATKSVTRFS